MTPAAPLRRYVAWSLDAACLAVVAAALCLGPIRAGFARADIALAEVSDAMAARMLSAMRDESPMLSLVRGLLTDATWREGVTALAAALGTALWPTLLAFAALALPYYAGFEASRWQATPGKRLLGVRTVDADGARLPLHRAAWRHLAGALSWLTLNIGHLMAAAPPRYQALHDRLAQARVVQADAASALPAWAKAWLVAQGVAALAVLVRVFETTNAALEAALDRLLP